MTENLHALSADDPPFLRMLDLTTCSVVEVHEVRHPQRIRRRSRLSEPLRLPCQSARAEYLRPKIRSDQPHRMDPTLSPFSGLTGGPGSLCLVLCPFKGHPVDGLSSDSHVCKTKSPSIFRMQWYASLNPCDGHSHRCNTGTRVWQCEGSTCVEDHNVAIVNHS